MSLDPEPTLIEFFRYNHWANQKLMAICMKAGGDTNSTKMPGAYGSILETFGHILKAQASFLKRIHGAAPTPSFKWEDDPDLEQMAAYETELSGALRETLECVPVTQNVHEEGNGWSFDYQARLIFMSVAYHGISHRTDIMTMLNSKGIELPELDVWGYQAEFPERFEAKVSKSGE